MTGNKSKDIEFEFLTRIILWVELLERNDWASAFKLIDSPNSHGVIWNEHAIRKVIDEYAQSSSWILTKTDLNMLHEPIIGELDNEAGFYIDYPISLNHIRSDLTAQFTLIKQDTKYAIVLDDIHVL